MPEEHLQLEELISAAESDWGIALDQRQRDLVAHVARQWASQSPANGDGIPAERLAES